MPKSYLIDMDGVIVRGSELIQAQTPFSNGYTSGKSSF